MTSSASHPVRCHRVAGRFQEQMAVDQHRRNRHPPPLLPPWTTKKTALAITRASGGAAGWGSNANESRVTRSRPWLVRARWGEQARPQGARGAGEAHGATRGQGAK
jgi:hypothetical protein